MLIVAVLTVVNYGIYRTAILVMFVLLGGKHYEEYGICHLIHIVILCVNYLICYLFLMFSVNVCYLLFPSV